MVSRPLRAVLVAVLAAGALAVAALAALPWIVGTSRGQALIAGAAAQALGRPVTFASASLSVLPRPSVVLTGVEIAEDPAFGAGPFVRLRRAEARLRLGALLGLRVELGDLVFREPVVTLVQRADGRWNVTSLRQVRAPRASGRSRTLPGGAAAAPAAFAGRVEVEGGVVTLERRAGPRPVRYWLKDLNLALAAGPGPLTFEGRARLEPGDISIRLTDGSLGLDNVRSLAEAMLGARVTLDGADVRGLVASALGPEPSLAGALRGRLVLGGTVGAPRASGTLELSRVALTRTSRRCPEPHRRTLALGVVALEGTWEAPRLTARPLTVTLGGGTITAHATVTLDEGLRLALNDLSVKGVPLETILVDFLCPAHAVTGPLDLTGNLSLRLADPWSTLASGGQFRIGPGKVVGRQVQALMGGLARIGGAVSSVLGADVASALVAPPLDFQSITGSYTIAGGVVRTRDLRYVSGAVSVVAAGTYGLASGALDFDLTVTHGRRELKAEVTGTAGSPSIRVAPPMLLRGLDRGRREQGLRELLRRFR